MEEVRKKAEEEERARIRAQIEAEERQKAEAQLDQDPITQKISLLHSYTYNAAVEHLRSSSLGDTTGSRKPI